MGNDSFSFSNSVTGGTAQINQGQNVTATQTNTGGEPTWPDARDEAMAEVGPEQAEAAAERVDAIQAVAEIEQDDVPDDVAEEAQGAIDWLKGKAPGALRTVATLIRKGRKEGAAAGVELVAGWLED